jgi:hypothetical protein
VAVEVSCSGADIASAEGVWTVVSDEKGFAARPADGIQPSPAFPIR